MNRQAGDIPEFGRRRPGQHRLNPHALLRQLMLQRLAEGQHELAEKGVRVQAVLPGATATEFWDVAGLPVQHLPTEIGVMTAENLVDAALAGFDQGETVTIPSLPDKAEWDGFDAARRAMSGKLSRSVPAARYNVGRSAAAT